MRISDWSSDVCSSDLDAPQHGLCEPDELQPSADHLRGLQRAVAFFHQLLPAVQELQAARVSLDPRSGKGLTHINPAAITSLLLPLRRPLPLQRAPLSLERTPLTVQWTLAWRSGAPTIWEGSRRDKRGPHPAHKTRSRSSPHPGEARRKQ